MQKDIIRMKKDVYITQNMKSYHRVYNYLLLCWQ